ncbi:MAG: DEAD/DEAH box helicase family protein [Anaerolineae bacterium]|nr:DEAD/DEAH box helicase family protein [Anaerolineae bacterium]
MTPEELARQKIDAMLVAAGWTIQNKNQINLGASLGVAVREYPVQNIGEADYLLFVDRKPVGVVEAKPEGFTLGAVHEQTEKYQTATPANLPQVKLPLPFGYESTGSETRFTDLRDPDPRQRPVFSFHRPETLADWLKQGDTVRKRLRYLPPLDETGLRDCQVEAIKNLEVSLSQDRPRALIQMATGSGKTFTAVSAVYRLIKFANARRILFLVDRNNLGRQTLREFQQYRTPDDGRLFTELYNVQHLTSNALDKSSRVCITTIQRLYSMLRGETEFEDDLEERSLFDLDVPDQKPRDVAYNPNIPIETFDFIITDECHRSIYNVWRQVLDYFDAHLIGLTATPSKQTLGFFNQNLVTEYSHERAVADGVNVGFDVYRIKTAITSGGSKVDAGFYVDKRDRQTRRMRWEQLDADLEYGGEQLDRAIVAPDQIRTIIRTFRDKLPEIFPGRTEVPKTLIFAKDDTHAEDILHIVSEEFAKGNEFAKKITYRVTGEKPEDLIASFRNSYNPRIAVTVDMISTGTDIKPLECLLFMRDVRSAVYFEQMKGRGTRTISETDLNAVTPDAAHKTHFVIVDAIGVTERIKTDSRPLERKRSVSFEKLLTSVAVGARDEDTLSSLAGRLARLDRELDSRDRAAIQKTGGAPLSEIVNQLLDAIEPETQIARAQTLFNTPTPTDAQITDAATALADEACAVFDNPDLRNLLVETQKRNEQTIDNVSKDTVLSAGFDADAAARARRTVESFEKFIADNKDEITALQILYNLPYSRRHLTYAEIRELADAISKPPYNLDADKLWQAYAQLDKSKVRGASTQKLLTNLVSLVRFALGQDAQLEPFSAVVDRNFSAWLSNQNGRVFTLEQQTWLTMIKDHIITSAAIGWDDFDDVPFNQHGGRVKAYYLFGSDLEPLMEELNTVLVG